MLPSDILIHLNCTTSLKLCLNIQVSLTCILFPFEINNFQIKIEGGGKKDSSALNLGAELRNPDFILVISEE